MVVLGQSEEGSRRGRVEQQSTREENRLLEERARRREVVMGLLPL
jgi:hypothetical protein